AAQGEDASEVDSLFLYCVLNDDPEWTKMQNNLRTGDCDDADLALVRSRVVGRAGGAVKSFEDAPWRDAPILTYRNDLRQRIHD
ncbi:unnamed protein product, partial [Didymodactylos carnosus]